jgi:uncharacterized protein (TIGR02001 family)
MGTNVRTGFVVGAVATLAACMAERALAQAPTPNLNSYVTVASGYWRRGLAQNDGSSVQVGLDYGHHSGWFAGVQAANVDYEAEQGRLDARDIELDGYVGYHGRARAWSWTATLARYVYPGAAGDYDYSEIGAGVGFRERVFYNASYSRGLASGFATLNHELSLAWPVLGGVEIGATVGRFDFELVPADFTHWNVGASKIWRRLVIDLRYHDNDYGRSTALGDAVGNGYVLSATYALRRR